METSAVNTTSESSTIDDSGSTVHIMGVDEEGVEVIVGIRWENL